MAENLFMTTHASTAQLGLTIGLSDIIDVIREDKDYGDPEMSCYTRGGTPSEANCSAVSSMSRDDLDADQKKNAFVQIVEQPQPKALRFRYICEGRSAGSIPGVRSTAENKTYPTIKIVGYKGPAVVVVSCVTVDPPYRPHPHNLVGKEGCSKGVCTLTIDNDAMECMFSNLGIQCVKKKDVEQALKLREEIRVDPYNTGFGHRNQPQSIDLNAVRLCFQVFLSSGKNGRFTFPLKPVVSEPIYDKKATSDLNICKLSECTSCVTGGKEIILLCDKVTKEDIQIRFFEIKDGRLEWEAYGDFLASDVHKQVAISFKTPKYKNLDMQHPVKCYIQLQRPSDKATSEPRPFEYLPMDADPLMKKRRGNDTDPYGRDEFSQMWAELIARKPAGVGEAPVISVPRSIKVASRSSRLSDKVKTEPPGRQAMPPQNSVHSILPSPSRPPSPPVSTPSTISASSHDPFGSLSPSPEPCGVRGLIAPISPQHNGGGLVFQNPTSIAQPSPHLPIHVPVQQLSYLSTSPGSHLVSLPIHSPQPSQYFQMTPAILLENPYSPENSPGAAAFSTTPIKMPPTTNDARMDIDVPGHGGAAAAAAAAEEMPQYHDLDASKPELDTSSILPDLGLINSSELGVIDNMSLSNLSASLSNSLNIVDMPSMNNLDKKPELEIRVERMTASGPYTPNIQPVNFAISELLKEDSIPPMSSDSLKNLTMDLENFNKLTERS